MLLMGLRLGEGVDLARLERMSGRTAVGGRRYGADTAGPH